LKIAYVRSSLLTGSGIVNHLMAIATRIKEAGNEVAVISRETKIKSKDIPIHQVGFAGDAVPFVRNFLFPFRVLRLLEGADLIHTQYHPCIFAGDAAAEFTKKPHVFTYHGFAPVRTWRSYKQKIKMIDHRLGTFLALRLKVDKIITVSHFLKEELMDKYFVEEEKIQVIYNGVDTQRFNPEVNGESIRKSHQWGNRPLVLYLGRLNLYKGVQFLIQAVPLVLREVPEAKFVIGGAIRYDVSDLSQLIKTLKVRDSVVFTGYVPDRDVSKLYACCDVFCYPSLWEGFGLTPAEAQACGKPVVAFNTCAIPEVVENTQTGLLVEPRNVEALAEALVSLLRDEERRISMGLKARDKVVTHFSWDKAAEQTLRVYREVIS
jgi:glycogen(starch) synthase